MFRTTLPRIAPARRTSGARTAPSGILEPAGGAVGVSYGCGKDPDGEAEAEGDLDK